ncbi:MAG TPA: nuclear transport factor 2 family protein [Cellvibrionaceae bacterium]
MNYKRFLIGVFNLIALNACTPFAMHDQKPAVVKDSLFAKIAELDRKVFNAFNSCKSPEQLNVYASYFAPDVEFYHDSGGVTWTREAMLSNTKKYVCGVFQRELVPGSLKVFPVKDFGAISEGEHRFCHFGKSHCDGVAKFTIIWRERNNTWEILRVLSYGHRANK